MKKTQWIKVPTDPAPKGWGYYTLGRDQGQIVEVSYGRYLLDGSEPYGDERDGYMRVIDHSDQSVTYYKAV